MQGTFETPSYVCPMALQQAGILHVPRKTCAKDGRFKTAKLPTKGAISCIRIGTTYLHFVRPGRSRMCFSRQLFVLEYYQLVQHIPC